MKEEEVKRIKNIAETAAESGKIEEQSWKFPTPFFEYDLPPFPTNALPKWLMTWVEAEATATQTPTDLAGMLALCVIATAGAKKFEVTVHEEWKEPLNLYVVVGLEPANRKSAVFRKAIRPIEEYEKIEAERLKPEITKAITQREILEAKLKKAKSSAAKADEKDTQEECQTRAIDIAKELETIYVPESPRYIADDCSPERLGSLLTLHKGRIAVLSPEGDIFDLMAGRYSAKGMPNIGVFLKGHTGDDCRVDRMGRPSEFVPNPAITLGLTVQPSVIRNLINRPDFKGRGLIARILYSLPESRLGHRDTNPPPIAAAISTSYHQNVQGLFDIPWNTNSQGEYIPHSIRLSLEAWEIFDQFHKAVESQLSSFGQLGNVSDWGGKLVGAVARIAGNLHIAEHVGNSSIWKTPISEQIMRNAIRIGQYLIPHAKAAYMEMGSDTVIDDAKHVLKWLGHKGVKAVSKRDIYQATKGRFQKIEQLEPALTRLIDNGYLREFEKELEVKLGRKPSPTYKINPWVYSKDAKERLNSEDSGNSEDKNEKSNIGPFIEIPTHLKVPSTEVNPNYSDKPPEFPQFPFHEAEHIHDYGMVTDSAGTFKRCKFCGAFPKDKTAP